MTAQTFFCSGCTSIRDYADVKRWAITSESSPKLLKFCRSCVRGTVTVHDVFFDGKPEHGLANGPDGKPRVFGSKAEKAAYLKDRGLVEAGDRVRGSYPTVEAPPKADSRTEVKEALRQVARMSPNQRKQEFLRITRERR